MKSIKDIKNLKGKRVLLRLDVNVPIENGKIIDDFRLLKSMMSINFLIKKRARIIIIGHLGDDGTSSLEVIFKYFKKSFPIIFNKEVFFSPKFKQILENQKNGEIVLLENIRRNKGEIENSKTFVKEISSLGDIYVNDAFSVSHRKHASIIGIPKILPSCAGIQLYREVKNLSNSFKPVHPFLFIVGGAKFETKIPLINKFIKPADDIFIGGALMNDFLKAKGYFVGDSLINKNKFNLNKLLKEKSLILPVDAKVLNKGISSFKNIDQISKGDVMVDIGPESVKILKEKINKAKFILWNGPLGKFDNNFIGATKDVLKLIIKSKAKTIVGGGDTVAFISKMKIENKLDFVSTGGGATLDFLSKGTLPGIEALK